jgi:DDE superfamily endonuclease
MFSYAAIKDDARLFLAMTGLTRNEFEKMLPAFQKAWDEYIQHAYIDREGRQRQYGGGQQASTLVSMEDKLLFILYYVKVYPLQEILAFEFGISQSTANEWIHLLSGVLKRALDFGGHLPQRHPKQLHRVLQEESEAEYGIDGTERRRQRPVNEEQQKLYYSGKKKRIRSKML